jgi:hypothetical protein
MRSMTRRFDNDIDRYLTKPAHSSVFSSASQDSTAPHLVTPIDRPLPQQSTTTVARQQRQLYSLIRGTHIIDLNVYWIA